MDNQHQVRQLVLRHGLGGSVLGRRLRRHALAQIRLSKIAYYLVDNVIDLRLSDLGMQSRRKYALGGLGLFANIGVLRPEEWKSVAPQIQACRSRARGSIEESEKGSP